MRSPSEFVKAIRALDERMKRLKERRAQAESGFLKAKARINADAFRFGQAHAMRASGLTYKQIAERLGVSTQRAWKILNG